jgi:membrane protein
MWMVITQFYSYWVGNIAHYDIIYGSISSIIILLIWMYFLAYIFVIGLVLNAGIDCEKKEII